MNSGYQLRKIAEKMVAMDKKLEQLRSVAAEVGFARVEDMPGRKMPFIADVKITLAASTATQRGVYTVSQTGPYLIGAVGAFWRETSEARWRPISSHVHADRDGALINAVNFTWTVKTAGADHFWQNEPLPSTLLFSNFDRPYYTPGPPVVAEPNSSLVVEITPIKAPDAAGDLHFCFIGAYVIDTARFVR